MSPLATRIGGFAALAVLQSNHTIGAFREPTQSGRVR